MTKILKGNDLSNKIKKDLKSRILNLKSKGIIPKIAIIKFGNNPDDISYKKNIIKNSESLGIEYLSINLEENIETEELIDIIDTLNNDSNIHGILVLSLLNNRKDQDIIRRRISPSKDIDGVHPLNLEKIFRGEIDGFGPCAAIAAIKIIENENISLEGKDVVIVNRSMVIGKPLAMMALAKNATVTICHSKTRNLEKFTSNADIVFLATGKANYFDKKYFHNDSIVIDLGIAVDKNNKLCGDVDFEDVANFVKMITPVPGGIGSITTTLLLDHVVKSAEKVN